MKRIGQKNKLSVGWKNNKMISAKEDIKNTVKKSYGSNSLVEDTYENSELVNTVKTGGVWKFRYFKASTCHPCNVKAYRSKFL